MNKSELTVDLYGNKRWKLNGEYHREDGPAVEVPNGSKYWYLNGYYHREDGPAIENRDGIKEWYLMGKIHRVDGPAIEYPDGYKEWFINGKEYSQIEWFQKLTSEQQINYLWNLDE
jgi:hypothetical protein